MRPGNITMPPLTTRRIWFMYNPPHFAENDIGTIHAAIRANSFATLVSNTPDGLIANHMPLLLDPSKGAHGTLVGHLARPNPHTKATADDALAIFQGVNGYITPSYYETKRQNGKVRVPVWYGVL